MRIIAGQLRGRELRAPPGLLTRPSTDRVREALFNLVTHRVALQGARVLDTFAGTGALGLEAISRGAQHVVFVELNRRTLQSARMNAMRLGVADQCVFLRQDAVRFLERGGEVRYRVIFADPPYELPNLAELPTLALPLLESEGLFVLEHDKRVSFTDHPQLSCTRPYGRTTVTIFAAP